MRVLLSDYWTSRWFLLLRAGLAGSLSIHTESTDSAWRGREEGGEQRERGGQRRRPESTPNSQLPTPNSVVPPRYFAPIRPGCFRAVSFGSWEFGNWELKTVHLRVPTSQPRLM